MANGAIDASSFPSGLSCPDEILSKQRPVILAQVFPIGFLAMAEP